MSLSRPSRSLPVAVALAGLMASSAPHGTQAGEDESPSDATIKEGVAIATLSEEELQEQSGWLYTNSCDDKVNRALAREREAFLIPNQVLVSCLNARRNLDQICPEMFPKTAALLRAGPDRWLGLAYDALWVEQDSADGVILENRRVMERIEAFVQAALDKCQADGHEGRALSRCQRGFVKDTVEQ